MGYALWIVGGLLIVVVLFFLVPLVGGAPQLFFGRDGYSPDPFIRVVFVGSLIGAGVLVGLYFASMMRMQSEFEVHSKNKIATRVEAVSPIPDRPETSTQTERQFRISEYERRDFRKTKTMQFTRTGDASGPQIVLADLFIGPPPKTPEAANLWFQRAALVYEDGQVVDLKAAVLYGDEAWQALSDEHVAQKLRGRPVHIENAINRPLIQLNISQSHYAVCLGLASAQSTDPPNRNDELSDDRAVNLCRAVANLDFKKPEDVIGLSIGVARTEQDDADLQARQRAVIILGVDVFGSDLHLRELIRAATEVIQLNGVVISDYTRSEYGYTVFRGIQKGEYVGASNTNTSGGAGEDFFVLRERSG